MQLPFKTTWIVLTSRGCFGEVLGWFGGHCWRIVGQNVGTCFGGFGDVLGKVSGRLLGVNEPIRNLYNTSNTILNPIRSD